jgi:hypothetical protein
VEKMMLKGILGFKWDEGRRGQRKVCDARGFKIVLFARYH